MDDKKRMSQDEHRKEKRCMIHTVAALRSRLRYHHRPSCPPKSVSRPYPLQLQPSLQANEHERSETHCSR